MQCEARRRYECDRASLHYQGFNEGMEAGILQGIQQEQSNTLRQQERADAIQREKEALVAELRRLKAALDK